MKYPVIIEETISKTFEIEASSPSEACAIARRRYEGGIYVLEPGDLENTRFLVTEEDGTNLFVDEH